MKNFRKKLLPIILLMLAIIALPLVSVADEIKTDQKPVEQAQEEDKVTGELDLSVLNAYIWRGYEQTRDSVVVQPS
ncbi:MAG: hypothetical protein ABSF79_09205, partial [Smithellaceae bacterium]